MRIFFGDVVKETTPGSVGGYLIRFTTADDPDLYDTYFSRATDFLIDEECNTTRMLYRHGIDPKLKRSVIGAVKLTVDDVGVWAEGKLRLDDPVEREGNASVETWATKQRKMRSDYIKKINEMVAAGELGWSSGTSENMYEAKPTKKKGKTGREIQEILTWGIAEASLTPVPAEYRNQAISIRSYERAMTDSAGASTNLFEEAIAEYIPSRWELESKMCKMVEAVAMMAKMGASTGTEYDYLTPIVEILDGYNNVMKKHILGQVEDYLKNPLTDEKFYVRSLLIADTDLASHGQAAVNSVKGVIGRFVHRRADRLSRGLCKADIERLVLLRSALTAAVNDADSLLASGTKTSDRERLEAETMLISMRSALLNLET